MARKKPVVVVEKVKREDDPVLRMTVTTSSSPRKRTLSAPTASEIDAGRVTKPDVPAPGPDLEAEIAYANGILDEIAATLARR